MRRCALRRGRHFRSSRLERRRQRGRRRSLGRRHHLQDVAHRPPAAEEPGDQAGTFDKVYPIGPGAIENGVSLTPIGHFTTGPADTSAGASDNPNVVGGSPWSWWYRCKIWWTDPETKKINPVYGGLPLIRLNGPPTLGYALHGPVDSFGAPNGGSLRRGYVSHGCIRMRAEDILEVYVLLLGHGKVPVTVQRAVERDQW
ncbi:MAG: L,D-transpeptidase, partial [Deltaproteobacteria bacterium]